MEFFPKLKLIISEKKAWLPQIYFSDTHRKAEYLEIRRTYAQLQQ